MSLLTPEEHTAIIKRSLTSQLERELDNIGGLTGVEAIAAQRAQLVTGCQRLRIFEQLAVEVFAEQFGEHPPK